MAEYTESIEVQAPPDALFAYLTDVRNIPLYMPRLSAAVPAADGTVDVTAQPITASGEQVEVHGSAWVKPGDDGRTFSWGSSGGRHGYHGQFVVAEAEGGSRLTVTVTTERAGGDSVVRGLRDTLERIRGLVAP